MSSQGLYALFLLLLFNYGASQTIINTLPGFSGALPFKLETGYIGVGENDEVQLFYYFIESENNPNKDPLLLWITGGPGCSGLSTLVYELGPFTFDVARFDGSLPSILLNPYSWTKVASVIFIDWPVGTGFSYSNTSEGCSSSDTKSAKDTYTFLRKGYIIGNGLTVPNIDYNARIPYAHRMSLISDEYFKSAKISCDGKYYNRDPNNVQCLHALQLIQKCINLINGVQILEPNCDNMVTKLDDFGWYQTFPEDDSINHLVLPSSRQYQQWCRSQNFITSSVWANDPTVQEALHIRKGTITEWKRCNESISYERNVENVLQYHRIFSKKFSKKGYEVLIASGDHDMIAPYIGTLKWISMLNLTLVDNWRPWHVNGQVAGYTEKYKNNDFYLTFVTVKGAGHTISEYKPKECLAMFERWLSIRPL